MTCLEVCPREKLGQYKWCKIIVCAVDSECELLPNLNSLRPSTIRLYAKALWLASADRRLIFMALRVTQHKCVWDIWHSSWQTKFCGKAEQGICEGEEPGVGVWAEVRMDGKAGIHPELRLCQPQTPVNKATDLKS